MVSAVLLRNVIAVDAADDETTLRTNFQVLRHEIEPDGADKVVLDYIGAVVDRVQRIPTIDTLVTYFTHRRDAGEPDGAAALHRLADAQALAGTAPLDVPTFRVALDAYCEQVMADTTGRVLVEAANILKFGVQKMQPSPGGGPWQSVTVRGVEPALAHLAAGVSALQAKFRRGTVTSMANGTERVWQAYQHAKANPGEQFGVLSGLTRLDETHKGLKRGELALVLGFVGHMKTSFILNWIYKAAVFYRKSVALATLEMPIDVIERLVAVIHSAHPMFEATGVPLLTFEAVRSGALAPNQESLLRAALDDLRDNPDYGKIHFRHPEARMAMPDIAAWVEGYAQAGEPVDLLGIDYLGLVDPDKKSAGLEQNSNLNRVIRSSKLLSLEYAQGRGLAVLAPHQANRKGFEEAKKSGGRYTLNALADANQSERSADVIYTVWLDDALAAQNELVIGNLKTRNGPLIPDFRVYAHAATRLIDNLDTTTAAASALA